MTGNTEPLASTGGISGDFVVTAPETTPHAQRELAAAATLAMLEELSKKIGRDEASPEDIKLFSELSALGASELY